MSIPKTKQTTAEAKEVKSTVIVSEMILWRVSNGLMSVFFFLACFVQRNDPDSLFWMTLYIIPGVVCLLYSLNYSELFLLRELVAVHIAVSLAVAVYTFIHLKQAQSDGSGLLLHELEETRFLRISIAALGTTPLHSGGGSILLSHMLKETRELGGTCFVLCWLLLNMKYLHSDPHKKRRLARLLAVVSVMPILLWSSAHFSRDYQSKLPGHCKTAFDCQPMASLTE